MTLLRHTSVLLTLLLIGCAADIDEEQLVKDYTAANARFARLCQRCPELKTGIHRIPKRMSFTDGIGIRGSGVLSGDYTVTYSAELNFDTNGTVSGSPYQAKYSVRNNSGVVVGLSEDEFDRLLEAEDINAALAETSVTFDLPKLDEKQTLALLRQEIPRLEQLHGRVTQKSSILKITTLAFTLDNQRLIAGGSMGLAVWDLPIDDESPSAEIIDVPGPYSRSSGKVASMAITADGTELICATCSSGLLHRYAVSDLQRLHPSRPYQLGHLPPSEPMMVISDEGQVVVAEEQWPVVQCLSWPDGNVVRSITPVSSVAALAVSDNAAVLAIGTSRRVRLHDGRTGEFLRELIKP